MIREPKNVGAQVEDGDDHIWEKHAGGWDCIEDWAGNSLKNWSWDRLNYKYGYGHGVRLIHEGNPANPTDESISKAELLAYLEKKQEEISSRYRPEGVIETPINELKLQPKPTKKTMVVTLELDLTGEDVPRNHTDRVDFLYLMMVGGAVDKGEIKDILVVEGE